jgi:hypothetical protein
MLPYFSFRGFVKQLFFPKLHKTRLDNLNLLVYGLLRGHSCSGARLAHFFPLPSCPNHRLRWLWRFLRSPAFCW